MMATRSTIAVVLPNGSIRSVYVHFDGYISGVGKTLLSHWNSQELAEKITSIGDMSILGERINPIGEHSFDKPELGTCLLYGRDRGKTDSNPITYISLNDYYISNNKEEYNYLFFDNCWHVMDGKSDRENMVKFY